MKMKKFFALLIVLFPLIAAAQPTSNTMVGNLFVSGTTSFNGSLGTVGQCLVSQGTSPSSWGSCGGGFPSLAPDGSAAAPSYSFASSTGTGVYQTTTGSMGFATAGTLAATITGGATPQILAADGTAAKPSYSFANQTNTGMFHGGGALLWFSGNGITNFIIENGDVRVPAGTSSAPGITDLTSINTGLSWLASNSVSVTGAAGEMVRFKNKHIVHYGTAPTVTANCGASPSVVGRDEAMTVTVGTGGTATNCTMTFNVAFTTNPPVCVANSDTDIVALKVTTAVATVAIDAALAFTAGSKLHVICRGWE